MRAGQMDRRLTLRRRSVGAKDANGFSAEPFVEYDTVWARKVEIGGREFVQAGTKDAQQTTRFEIRWRDDVAATDRVTCEGVDYRLTAAPSEIGRRRGLLLFAEAIRNA